MHSFPYKVFSASRRFVHSICAGSDPVLSDSLAKFANSLSEEQQKIQRLQRELEKERLNSLRIQQKLEQDFDFHKQIKNYDLTENLIN